MFGKSLVAKSLTYSGLRSFASASFTPAKLPELKYDLNELEPVISAQIMELHYKKHHNSYVNGYNQSVEAFLDAQAKGDHVKCQQLTKKIRFHAGGHVNHSLFWENLAPIKKGGGQLPDSNSKLMQSINECWGSFDKFKEDFIKSTGEIQGSGWGFLAWNPATKKLYVQADLIHDRPELLESKALFTVDIWEHAFYLQYKNDKQSFLKEIWKIVNWKDVERRFNELPK